jgi:undecaprenyl phosphate N,N'-diacetylbacillosamine 1-phosphate transferase
LEEDTLLAGFQEKVKRGLDLLFASIGLAVLSPLFFLVSLAILMEDGRPVLFRQERVGRNGKRFRIFKFRTMVHDAESKGLFTHENDPRITRVGRILRRWSIDELPQLINVLLGQMSLVGPRPTLPYQTEKYTERQRRRLLVRPGITGLAQVKGRNALSWPEKIELDLQYVERMSLWLDFKIILMTIPALFKRKTLYKAPEEWEKDPIAKKEARP